MYYIASAACRGAGAGDAGLGCLTFRREIWKWSRLLATDVTPPLLSLPVFRSHVAATEATACRTVGRKHRFFPEMEKLKILAPRNVFILIFPGKNNPWNVIHFKLLVNSNVKNFLVLLCHLLFTNLILFCFAWIDVRKMAYFNVLCAGLLRFAAVAFPFTFFKSGENAFKCF